MKKLSLKKTIKFIKDKLKWKNKCKYGHTSYRVIKFNKPKYEFCGSPLITEKTIII